MKSKILSCPNFDKKSNIMKTHYLKKTVLILLFFTTLTFISCTKEEDSVGETESTLTVNNVNINVSIDENINSDTLLETISANTESGTIIYTIVSSTPSGALKLNASGEILVDDNALFDYETYQTITAVINVTNGIDTKEVNVTIDINDIDESTSVNLEKNMITSTDSDVFNLPASTISIQKVRSFKAEPFLDYIYKIKLIDDNNHGPLIMWISDLPEVNKTYAQAQTKSDTELKENEFNIEYVRSPNNNYLYGLGENAPVHNLEAVLENNVITFNIVNIELSGSSVFDTNRKKVSISFSVSLTDIQNHPGIARTYDLVE